MSRKTKGNAVLVTAAMVTASVVQVQSLGVVGPNTVIVQLVGASGIIKTYDGIITTTDKRVSLAQGTGGQFVAGDTFNVMYS